MDTAAKELECFQALQKQEQLAASHRINSIWEEVQKQKELERILQKRYGDLLTKLETTRRLMDNYREQAQRQEEIAANKHEPELLESSANQPALQSTENPEITTASDELGSSMPIDQSHNETAYQQMDSAQEHEGNGFKVPDDQLPKPDGTGEDPPLQTVAGENNIAQDSVNGLANDSTTTNDSAKEDHHVKNQPNFSEKESTMQETAVDGDAGEVSGGAVEI